MIAVFYAKQALQASRDQIAAARDQMDLVAKHELERLARREAAVRATLPLVLSGICAWSEGVTNDLKAMVVNGGVDQGLRSKFQPRPIPNEHLLALKEVIESTGNPIIVRRLSDLIGKIQIHHSRLHFVVDEKMIYNLDSIFRDLQNTANVYANSASMFKYARGQEADLLSPFTWGCVREALNPLNLHGLYSPKIWARIQNDDRSGVDPQNLDGF